MAVILYPPLLVLIVTLYLTWWAISITVRMLAERNLLWTIVPEPSAKAITIGGRVSYFLMTKMGENFKGKRVLTDSTVDIAEQWEIEHTQNRAHEHLIPEGIARFLPSFRGIHWIGLPPNVEVYTYRFTWNSLEEEPDPQNKDGVRAKLKLSEEQIDYILLQEDVYAFPLDKVECKDKIPLNSIILVGGRIINPYKALFRVERWLEAVSNRVGAQMRDFFGNKSYEELVSLTTTPITPSAGQSAMPQEMLEKFQPTIDEIRMKWGFEISFIRIYTIDPGSDLAKEFIQATTVKYVETQKADAAVEEGRGLAARDKAHFEAVAGIPGGVEMFKWQRIGESGLTTYVEGGGVVPAISIGGGQGQSPQGGGPRRRQRNPGPTQPANPAGSTPAQNR
jgi:hypothetical protein